MYFFVLFKVLYLDMFPSLISLYLTFPTALISEIIAEERPKPLWSVRWGEREYGLSAEENVKHYVARQKLLAESIFSPSTLITHYIKARTGWRKPQSTYLEASKLENKILFKLQRLNWRTKEMTSNKISLQILNVLGVFKSLVQKEKQKDKEQCYSPGCTFIICNW